MNRGSRELPTDHDPGTDWHLSVIQVDGSRLISDSGRYGGYLENAQLDDWFQFEEQAEGQYWLRVGPLQIRVRVATNGEANHVHIETVERNQVNNVSLDFPDAQYFKTIISTDNDEITEKPISDRQPIIPTPDPDPDETVYVENVAEGLTFLHPYKHMRTGEHRLNAEQAKEAKVAKFKTIEPPPDDWIMPIDKPPPPLPIARKYR